MRVEADQHAAGRAGGSIGASSRRASRENFDAAVEAWRHDASSDPCNVTLFYYSGHGLQMPGGGEQVMLLEGFGDGIGPKLRDGVGTKVLFDGMAPTKTQEKIARTQFYFIDSCRTQPNILKELREARPPTFWDVWDFEEDDRNATLLYTTVPGRKAFGIPGKGTIFGEAFGVCLDNGAGEPKLDGSGWDLTLWSLIRGLQYQLDTLNARYGSNQRFQFSPFSGNPIIAHLDRAPLADVEIIVDPAEAGGVTAICIRDHQNKQVRNFPSPVKPVFKDRLLAGAYILEATVRPPTRPWNDQWQIYQASHPAVQWPVRLG